MKRWVVKAGSQMIVSGGPLLIRDWMRQIVSLKMKHQIEVVWVTSGAIATAVARMRLKKRERTVVEKQSLSAIGQPLIMDLYNEALQSLGELGAQILLCYDDIKDSKRRQNFQNTADRLLEWGVTPIVNENDAVSTEEIQFGDNDSLSAKIACALSADRLIILTDVDGVYDQDPAKSKNARMISQLEGIPPHMLKTVSKRSGSKNGTGGMGSKLMAAKEATEGGIETWIARGDMSRVLERIAANEGIGTRIRRKPSRRRHR